MFFLSSKFKNNPLFYSGDMIWFFNFQKVPIDFYLTVQYIS